MAAANSFARTAPTLDPGTRIVILCGGAMATLALTAIASVLPQIDRALARAPGDHLLVKQLVGAVALAMVVGASIVGPLIDRIGIRRVLVVAAILYAVAGTAGLYLADLRSLLVSRLFVGVSAAAIQVACITLVNTRLAGVARARWMGLHISVAMVAAILAHPLAGVLGGIGWRLPFALYASGLILVPAALGQRDPVPSGAGIAAPPGERESLRAWFPFRYLPLAFAIGTLALMPSVEVPFLLRDKGLTSSTAIALVLTADSVAGAAMAMLYGKARAHISVRAAFAFSFATAAVGLLIAALAGDVAAVVAGLLVYGLGIGWFVPNLMTALSDQVSPARQGRAVGIVKAAHFLSAPVAVALVEPLARGYGPGGTLLAASGLAFLCLAVIGIQHARNARRS